MTQWDLRIHLESSPHAVSQTAPKWHTSPSEMNINLHDRDLYPQTSRLCHHYSCGVVWSQSAREAQGDIASVLLGNSTPGGSWWLPTKTPWQMASCGKRNSQVKAQSRVHNSIHQYDESVSGRVAMSSWTHRLQDLAWFERNLDANSDRPVAEN